MLQTIESRAIANIETDRLLSAMSKLPLEQHNTILLMLNGWSLKEIAADYGVTFQAIQYRRNEAIRKLREAVCAS